eukprot:scaffold80430_cov18-Prasinocladus_malaysianus.AAC.2
MQVWGSHGSTSRAQLIGCLHSEQTSQPAYLVSDDRNDPRKSSITVQICQCDLFDDYETRKKLLWYAMIVAAAGPQISPDDSAYTGPRADFSAD